MVLQNRREVLMKDADRFRHPQQLEMFEPAKTLPLWSHLPPNTRKIVMELVAKMLEDYYDRLCHAKRRRGDRDE
jgi:hypothetical protein